MGLDDLLYPGMPAVDQPLNSWPHCPPKEIKFMLLKSLQVPRFFELKKLNGYHFKIEEKE